MTKKIIQRRNFMIKAVAQERACKEYINTTCKLLFFEIIFLFAIQSVSATNYFVALTGSNNNAGTIEKPWKTIAYAAGVVNAGDTIFIRSGIYSETFGITKSGTSDNKRIVLRNYKNEKALIDGDGEKAWSCWVSGDWITLEGIYFKLKNPFAASQVNNVIINGDHVNIIRCNFIGTNPNGIWKSGAKESGIKLSGSEYTLIDGCTMTGLSFHGINIYQSDSGPSRYWIVRNTTSMGNYANGIMMASSFPEMIYGLVQNCTLGGSLVSDGLQSNGDYVKNSPPTTWGVLIDNNVFYGSAENGIDIKGARYFFIQNNIIYQNVGDNNGFQDEVHDRTGFGGITHGSNALAQDIVIRGNIVYSNSGGIVAFHYYWVYNNTVLGNNRDFAVATSDYNFPATSNIFSGFYSWDTNVHVKNNIFGGHLNYDYNINNSSLNESDYNLLTNDMVAVPKIGTLNSQDRYTLEQWKSLSVVQGQDQHSFIGNPKFANASSCPTESHTIYDFTPTSGSPAIDAAGPLTNSVGEGINSHKITVVNSEYFHGSEGWSVIGVTGDKIMIGGVEAIVDSVVGKTLILDRAISWGDNAPVFWCPNGDCPENGKFDIGAVQADSPPKRILSIGTISLPDAVLGVTYNSKVTVAGGISPYTWCILYESLPPGLTLDSGTGIISGIPEKIGSTTFVVRVEDKNSAIASLQYTLNVTSTTGAENGIKENKNIKIFPNPARNYFTIAALNGFASPAWVELFSLVGKKMVQTSSVVDFPFEVDISSFNPGLYVVKVFDKGSCAIKKILKE